MARYSHGLEGICGPIQSPHCHSCACYDGGQIEVCRNVSFLPLSRAHHISPRIIEKTCDDCCHPHHHIERCSCDIHPESLFQFPTTYVKEVTTTLSRDRGGHNMLDKWFKRYKNDDGYLGEADLTKLIQSLGGSRKKRPIGKALKEADADGDGQLSFREFLQMWHQAASHENNFLDATGCQDIVDIVNEYDLFPDVTCEDCDRQRYHSEKDDEEDDQINCNCGSVKDITPSVHRPDEKTSGSAVTKIGEYPLFSCNRLPACSPKNWRD